MSMFENFIYDTYIGHADRGYFSVDDFAYSGKGRIAIVGLEGAGKRTLCNSLLGWNAVSQNDNALHDLGRLTICDLPPASDEGSTVPYRLENADLVIFMIDGERELHADGLNWLARLRSIDAGLLVVLNKADLIDRDALSKMSASLEEQVGQPVMPLVATSVEDVRNNLLPALLRLCPELAIPLATELPGLRNIVALHLTRQTAVLSLSVNSELGTHYDHNELVELQLGLIRQIAVIYGYKGHGRHSQWAGMSLILRFALRFLYQQSVRMRQLDRRISSRAVNFGSTLAIGRIAMLVYGSHLPRWLVRYTPQAWRMHYDAPKSE